MKAWIIAVWRVGKALVLFVLMLPFRIKEWIAERRVTEAKVALESDRLDRIRILEKYLGK